MASNQDLFHQEGRRMLFTGIIKTNKSYQEQVINLIRNRESSKVSNKLKIDRIKDPQHRPQDGNKMVIEADLIFN